MERPPPSAPTISKRASFTALSITATEMIAQNIDDNEYKSMHQVNVEFISEPCSDMVRDVFPIRPLPNIPTRESRAVEEEKIGLIFFRILFNDQDNLISKENILILISVKCLFAYQLPKIPKEYITRLIFDSQHKSLILFKNDQVIGGICFRPFPHKGFSEIVFCAISTSEQVKGYGTRLMNHLKDYHIRQHIYKFLTYADEFAIGYFKKQGFSKINHRPIAQYQGYIKEYQGATLMECILDFRICYTALSNKLQYQRRLLLELIRNKSKEISIFRKPLPKYTKMIIENVIGLETTGWKSTFMDNLKEVPIETVSDVFFSMLKSLYHQLKSHPSSWPFIKPVSTVEVPDYYEIVKNPMDFKTIGDNLKFKQYSSMNYFFDDMNQIFMNCRVYNDKVTEYYVCANNLEHFFHLKMREAGFL